MGDALANLPVGGIGSGALVGLIVLLILNGRLVTRQTVVDLRADRDKWMSIAETWQAVATQNGVTLAQHTETLAELIEGVRTANHAIVAIQSAVEHPT
jgi:hypothetical protein